MWLKIAADLKYCCRDARKARRPRRGPGASSAPNLVKGEASHRSGRQTDYRRQAGRRVNADMGASGVRLDGMRGPWRNDFKAVTYGAQRSRKRIVKRDSNG